MYTKLAQSNFDFELDSHDCNFDHDVIIPIYNRSEVSIDNDYEMDIHGVIYTNLSDRYSNKYKKITVTRQSNNTTETFIVPLILPDIIIPQKGEQTISNEKYGDVIIKIICKEHPEYKQINDADIVLIKYITLYQYLYGGKFQIILPDNTEFDIEFNSFIEKVPIICMQNKGLPVLNDNIVHSEKQSSGIGLTQESDQPLQALSNSSELCERVGCLQVVTTPRDLQTEGLTRGNLYIYIKIDGIDTDQMKQQIEENCN